MTIEELREAYRLAREAHAEAETAVSGAKVACDIASCNHQEVLSQIDGSIDSERDYLAAKETLNNALTAVHDANATWAKTEQANRQAKAAYLAVLDGEAELQGTPRESGIPPKTHEVKKGRK